MKVLYVVEHYYPYIGGVEKLFKSLTEGAKKMGLQPVVVTTKHAPNLPSHEIINGVEVKRIPLKNRYLFTFFGWIFLLPLVKDVALVHTTSYNAALPALIASKLFRKPCLVTFHEVWRKQWFHVPFLNPKTRWLFYLYESFILKLPFSRWVAVSNFTYSSLIKAGIKKDKVVKVYNGVTIPKGFTWSGPESNSFEYLFFGRLGVSKGIDLMVPAAQKFQQQHPNAVFHFVLPKYPAGIRKQVLQLMKAVGLKNYKLYHELPYVDLLTLMSRVSCTVIPSLSEGFGFSAAECCGMGVPIISSERGALPEVTHGKVIAMETHTIDGLVKALQKAQKKQYDEKTPKEFSMKKMVNDYLKVYQELIG